MTVSFHAQREVALERALRAMLRAARKAVVAQERYDYWTQFQTNSPTAQRAEERLVRAMEALDKAENQATEALDYA